MWTFQVRAGLRWVGMAAVAGSLWLHLAGAQAPMPAGQNKTTVTMPPRPLLADHVADLTASETHGGTMPARFTGKQCAPDTGDPVPDSNTVGDGSSSQSAPEHGIDCQALMKEDGLTRYSAVRYGRTGTPAFSVFALEFGDATGAYSAYTTLRTGMSSPHVTEGDARSGKAHETTTGKDVILVWAGTAVLQADARMTFAEVAGLVAGLPKVGGRAALAPLLPTLEPADGRERGTERYAIGPVGYQGEGGELPAELLGWQKSAEALTSSYGPGRLTLLLYPTPQIAGDRGRGVQDYINWTVQQEGTARFGTVQMRRLGPLVGVTTGGLSAGRAKQMLASLKLNQEVSFDKPMPHEFHAEIQKTYSLMQSIALFCGLGLVACVLLALFLGGARAGIRVLQGKPAATEPEFLTINLRGEAKGVLLDRRQDGSEPR